MRLKILILKPSSLGDVVHALPLLRILKQHYPWAKVHWWIEDGFAPLLADDPDLEKVHIFHRRNWNSLARFCGQFRLIMELREENFDWVIDLQGLARSAWFGWLVGGGRMIGLDSGREGARAFYDILVNRHSTDTHAVDWCLDAARLMGLDTSRSFEWLPEKAAMCGMPLDPCYKWIVFCPGARWPSKCWPLDYFVKLASKLEDLKGRVRIAILGTEEDIELGEAIGRAAPEICLDLTGKTTLVEMVDCLRCARVVVANDSGPLHLAVALNRPLVGLYGPTHSAQTGPYGRSSDAIQANVSCSPCRLPYCRSQINRECMKVISPDIVKDAILSNL